MESLKIVHLMLNILKVFSACGFRLLHFFSEFDHWFCMFSDCRFMPFFGALAAFGCLHLVRNRFFGLVRISKMMGSRYLLTVNFVLSDRERVHNLQRLT